MIEMIYNDKTEEREEYEKLFAVVKFPTAEDFVEFIRIWAFWEGHHKEEPVNCESSKPRVDEKERIGAEDKYTNKDGRLFNNVGGDDVGDTMNFPETWEQFLHYYEFPDRLGHYTNDSQLVSSFRVKQMVEHYFEPVKHGRWIHTDMAATPHSKDECSECRYATKDRIDLSYFKYCPNCGARMDLEDTP